MVEDMTLPTLEYNMILSEANKGKHRVEKNLAKNRQTEKISRWQAKQGSNES